MAKSKEKRAVIVVDSVWSTPLVSRFRGIMGFGYRITKIPTSQIASTKRIQLYNPPVASLVFIGAGLHPLDMTG